MNKLTTLSIPLNDPYVYKFLSLGKTKGIFQIESPGMQSLMKQMYSDIAKRLLAIETKYQCTGFEHPFNGVKVDYTGTEVDEAKIKAIKDAFMEELKTLGNECFERLIAAISLYRPGPMDYIPQYVAGMLDPTSIKYDCPELEEILSGTYGVIVYQEQVQQIVRKLAGYSLGRGDLIRRAMGKKKTAIMNAEKEVFLFGNEGHLKEGEQIVPGCIKNGIDEEAAKIIWDKMAEFAKYAFNKSHSAGYAVITIQTAWMKFYYPVDMLMATLNSVISKSDKLKVYVAEAADMEVDILTPNVNSSDELYKIEDNGIRTGLMALRNMGKMAIPIIEERKANGEFKDIYDFINRMLSGVDKKVIEALTYAGALDTFGYSRAALINSTPEIIDYTKYVRTGKYEEQPFNLPVIDKLYSEMGKIEIKNCPEFERGVLLEKEYEYTGMYISGHPLDLYSTILEYKGVISTTDIVPEMDEETGERPDSPYDGQSVQIAGVVRNLKPTITKKGDKMYMADIEDKQDKIRIVIFPKAAKVIDSKLTLKETDLVILAGKVQDSDRGCQIIVDDLDYVSNLDIVNTSKVYIDCRSEEDIPDELVEFIESNPGATEVWVKTKKGWSISKKNIDIDWPNYMKLRNKYNIKLG